MTTPDRAFELAVHDPALASPPTRVVVLPNGARLIMHDLPHTQSVSVAAFVSTGSRNETEKLNGISHFLEHMAFKGTKKRDYKKISQDVERLGAEINAFTDKDTTAYFVTGMRHHVHVFIDLIGDILCNSTFPLDQIEVERGVVLQEYKKYADNTGAVADQMYDQVSYPGTSFGRKILGEPRNIKAFTQKDLVDYVAAQYTGPGTVITVVGNLQGEFNAIVNSVSMHFKKLPNRAQTLGVEVPRYVGGVALKKKSSQQVSVILGFKSVTYADNLRYAMAVAAELLGGGMSSPLFDEIREKRGLAYTVGCDTDTRDNCGTFYIQAGTTPEHLEAFFNVTIDLLLQHTEKIGKIDLERAKNSVCFQIAKSHESPFGIAYSAASDLFLYNKVLDVNDEITAFRAVTPANVRSAFKHLIKSVPTISIVGKGADQKDADRYLNQVVAKLHQFQSGSEEE